MKILGIETVTRVGSLAVVENGEILGQVTIDTALRHASGFIASLDNLLKFLKIDLKDIDAVGIDIGPGSFTGIRIGLISCLGLFQPDNKPIAGICSLEALCYQAREFTDKKILMPIIDAKRGAFYSACFRNEGGKIKLTKKPFAAKIEEMGKYIPKNCFVFGPDIKKFRGVLMGRKDITIDTENTYPYAGMIAKIAGLEIKEDKVKKSLEPLYIHDIEYHKGTKILIEAKS